MSEELLGKMIVMIFIVVLLIIDFGKICKACKILKYLKYYYQNRERTLERKKEKGTREIPSS